MQFQDFSGQEFEMPQDTEVQRALNPNPNNLSADDPNVARDLVCGALVDKRIAGNTIATPVNVPEQETLYFCSERCKMLFEQDPQRYGFNQGAG
jgi:hypothetical protein